MGAAGKESYEERGWKENLIMNGLTIFSTDLIPVYTTSTGEKVVIGRELHASLKIGKDYSSWFRKMVDYGFKKNEDFTLLPRSGEQKGSGGHNKIDHVLKFDMAKHICMIQRTEKGKEIRQKLIELEKAVQIRDSYLIEDPIERAKVWIKEEQERRSLIETTKIQEQQLLEFQPKASYYDKVLQSKEAIRTKVIAGDYGMSAQKFNKKLNELHVQYKVGNTWVLYREHQGNGYTQTKTFTKETDNGYVITNTHTCWTQKGRLFLYDLLKSNGILPVIEQE